MFEAFAGVTANLVRNRPVRAPLWPRRIFVSAVPENAGRCIATALEPSFSSKQVFFCKTDSQRRLSVRPKSAAGTEVVCPLSSTAEGLRGFLQAQACGSRYLVSGPVAIEAGKLLNADLTLILLRDPVERFLSYYQHHKYNAQSQYHQVISDENLSPSDFADLLTAEDHFQIRNPQVSFITKGLTKQTAEAAWEILQRNDVVWGRVDEIDWFLERLQDITRFALSAEPVISSPSSASSLCRDLEDLIKSRCKEDCRLFEMTGH